MMNEEIDKDMEILLKKLLGQNEFETLKKIIESRGRLIFEKED